MPATKVPKKRRLLAASSYAFPWPVDGGPWLVTLGFAADGRGLRCISVAIHPADPKVPATVTRTLLRDLPVDEITRARAGAWRERLAAEGFIAAAQQLHIEPADPRGRTESFYRQVAEVYEGSRATGKPTKAVADKWEVSTNRAATWVRRARQRKLLPPTAQGSRQ